MSDSGSLRRSRRSLMTPSYLKVMGASLAFFIANGAVIAVLPVYLAGPLGSSRAGIGVAMGSFSVASLVLRPFIGKVGDRRGRRLIIIGGAVVAGLSILLYLTATSLVLVTAFRICNGVGQALFYVGTASAVNDLAPDGRRGEAFSLFSLGLFGGLAIGPAVAEILLESTGFSTVWIFASAFAFLAAVVAVKLTETKPRHAEDSSIAPASRRLLHPAGVLPGVALAASISGYSCFNTYIPLYAREQGLSGARWLFILFTTTIILVRGLGARIPDDLGALLTAQISLCIGGVGLLLLGIGGSHLVLALATILFGLGQSLSFPALLSLAVSGSNPREHGAVVGTFTAFFDLAFGGAAFLLGVVAGRWGYDGALTVAGVTTFAGLIPLMVVKRQLTSRGVLMA